jgi:hypothetical protein
VDRLFDIEKRRKEKRTQIVMENRKNVNAVADKEKEARDSRKEQLARWKREKEELSKQKGSCKKPAFKVRTELTCDVSILIAVLVPHHWMHYKLLYNIFIFIYLTLRLEWACLLRPQRFVLYQQLSMEVVPVRLSMEDHPPAQELQALRSAGPLLLMDFIPSVKSQFQLLQSDVLLGQWQPKSTQSRRRRVKRI